MSIVTILNGEVTINSGIEVAGTQTPNTELYTFSTITFNNANTLGNNGPTLSQCISAYSGVANPWLNDINYFDMQIPGYQRWTVPKTGIYEIEVAGARAGIHTGGIAAANATSYGRGVIVRGRVTLNIKDIIVMVCGQVPANTATSAQYIGCGGGGGTFVYNETSASLIMVAGGGGGTGYYSAYNPSVYVGKDAVTTTSGTSSNRGNQNIATSGLGGWANNQSYGGGAGGGYLTAGRNGQNVATVFIGTGLGVGGGGKAFQYTTLTPSANGSNGGHRSTALGSETTGGFGAGGGGGGLSGGGGGGYSGGAGNGFTGSTQSDGGGGGGSFIISTATNVATTDGNYNGSSTFNGNAITNLATYNSANGYVKITFISA